MQLVFFSSDGVRSGEYVFCVWKRTSGVDVEDFILSLRGVGGEDL